MIPTDSFLTAHYEKNNSLNMIISNYNYFPTQSNFCCVYRSFFLTISSKEMWVVLTNTTFSNLWVLDSLHI